jgi:Chromo (CHRromatin Organisation MOdifier) domain
MRKDATDAIVMTQQKMIKYDNVKWKSIAFAVNDKTYLRLNTEKDSMSDYTLSSTIKPKLSQQRADLFEVMQIVKKNAYRLKLPIIWKIWPVISVIYLESAKTSDLFDQELSSSLFVIRNADDSDAEWKVETIVKKRTIRETRRRKDETEYLLQWKRFGSEFDEWKNKEELEKCKKLIKKYEMSVSNYKWSSSTSWNNESNSMNNAIITNSDFISTEIFNVTESNSDNAVTTNFDFISNETFNVAEINFFNATDVDFFNISSIFNFDSDIDVENADGKRGQDLLM